MLWKYLKAFYYKLFCTHPINTSEKYYRAEWRHGYIDITVYVCHTCEKCGHNEVQLVSKHSDLPREMEYLRKGLEEKGYRNVEDL